MVGKAQLRSALERVRAKPGCGKPLVGTLAGCRSVRVVGSENRLVYRVLSDSLILVLAVERRRGDTVYNVAATRI